jgi:hypothetical protein
MLAAASSIPLRVVHVTSDRLDRLGPIPPGSVTCVLARSADRAIPRLIESVENRDRWAIWRLFAFGRPVLGAGLKRGPVEFRYQDQPLCTLSAGRTRRAARRVLPHHGKELDLARFSVTGIGSSAEGVEALVLIVDPVLSAFELKVGGLAPRTMDVESVAAVISKAFKFEKGEGEAPDPPPPRFNVERLEQTLSTEALLFIRHAVLEKEKQDKRQKDRKEADS